VWRVRRTKGYNASNTIIQAWSDICEAANIPQCADEKQLNYPKAITVMLLEFNSTTLTLYGRHSILSVT